MLSDVDSCASCHPDAAAQWSTSPHSFASFGNPIYRFDVELVRGDLGKTPSRHCGGGHDMPLMVDGLMTSDAPIPASDLRAHSGVTCRLCHGVQSTTHDGNGSYVWNAAPIDAPVLGDVVIHGAIAIEHIGAGELAAEVGPVGCRIEGGQRQRRQMDGTAAVGVVDVTAFLCQHDAQAQAAAPAFMDLAICPELEPGDVLPVLP